MTVIEQIRQRYVAWRARGRSREGFFRLVCRGFDDVMGACGGLAGKEDGGRAADILFLEADFSVKSFRASEPDFARVNQSVAGLGIFGSGTPLDGTEEDEVWYYALALVAEKALAWLAQNRPGRAELLLALGRVKERLHKPEEAAELYGEARRKWESQAKRMRKTAKQAAI